MGVAPVDRKSLEDTVSRRQSLFCSHLPFRKRPLASSRRHVIHTVGPVYAQSEAEEKAKQLASCYRTSMEVAVENGARHVVRRVSRIPHKGVSLITMRSIRRFRPFRQEYTVIQLKMRLISLWTRSGDSVIRR